MRKKAIKWIDWTRSEELHCLKDILQPFSARSARLLEIGGGNGFLARQLTEMGFEVVSIDPHPRQPSHFPVRAGTCRKLEFDDNSFDVIFSSNVLEHIEELPAALEEMKRVLKPQGIMVHTMPTPFTTLLTMLTQPIGYLFGVGFVLNQLGRKIIASCKRKGKSATGKTGASNLPSTGKSLNRQDLGAAVKMLNPLRLIISPPHGISCSCRAELKDWTPGAWRQRLEQQHLQVKETIELPLAYSRNAVLPFRLVGLRRRLARKGKTSCIAYVIQA